MKRTFWTEEEKQRLIANSKTLNRKDLREIFPNRTMTSIDSMLHELNIKAAKNIKYNRYSKEEVDFIKKNYNKLSVADIAVYLKRTTPIVRSKLNNLKIRGISSLVELNEVELEFIKQNYLEMSNQDIADSLGIKKRRVEGELHKMGIRRRLNFNINEQSIIFCPICKNKFAKTKENFYFTKENRLSSSLCKSCAKNKCKNHISSLDNYIKMLLRGINGDVKRKNKKGFTCDLSFEYIKELYIKQNGKCSITNIDLTNTQCGGKLMSNISIDRIDSSVGYIKSNVQLVCVWANLAKTSLSMDEFKEFINKTYFNLNKLEPCQK